MASCCPSTSPSCLFPLAPSLASLSLLQVRSSLGTNLLSAMAAFAGTAILLMDFGVTNWVCCPMSPGVVNSGEWQSRTQQGTGSGSLQPQGAEGPSVLTDPISS